MAGDLPKLVRDRVPEFIEADGLDCSWHRVDGQQLRDELAKKLVEEAKEFRDDPSLAELADVLQVIDDISVVYRLSMGDVKMYKRTKRKRRGGFQEGVILVSMEAPDDD